MKHLLTFLFLALTVTALNAQSPIGAWESITTSKSGVTFKTVVIFSDYYQVSTTYDKRTGKFKSTNGGSWSLDVIY